MKHLIYVLVVCVVVLQLEVLALLWYNGSNLKVWNAQMDFNNHVIELFYANQTR